jgi:hypothetical protein
LDTQEGIMSEDKVIVAQAPNDLPNECKQEDYTSGRCVKIAMEPPAQVQVERTKVGVASSPSNAAEMKVSQTSAFASTGEKRIRVQLTWENIVVKPKVQLGDKEKLILDHVSGTVRPEQFLAIIGASGTL